MAEEFNSLASDISEIMIYPYGINLFHIVSLYLPYKDFLRVCIQNRIPFLLDREHYTPLHYILNHSEGDSSSVNFLLDSFPALMEKNIQKAKIMTSLTLYVPWLIRIDSPQVGDFLKYTVINPPTDLS